MTTESSGLREIGKNADGWALFALSREDFGLLRPGDGVRPG
jgi:hypothetical protein